ncbi:hypothetical protein [Pseudoalteromonas sp.]|uniref:hypothetical protein n=1 Tax=Pseudoalteromonas sp. TaxID=53249 RepID=UPI0035C68E96|tara:strand:+ start:14178 stop:14633 length:456 start_codon:yes stop_codon:yes gene_type:complete
MSTVIEVVLDSIEKSDIKTVLNALLIGKDNVINISASEDEINVSTFFSNNSYLDDFFMSKSESTLLFLLKKITVGNVVIPNPLLRLVKYDTQFDIDFSFENEVDVHQLHMGISCLLKGVNVKEFYAGLEPAQDIDTRFFTNQELGPYQIKN